jgi:hypothetical protein
VAADCVTTPTLPGYQALLRTLHIWIDTRQPDTLLPQ